MDFPCWHDKTLPAKVIADTNRFEVKPHDSQIAVGAKNPRVMGDDCTPGRGIRDMMQPEANKPEAVDRRSRACWPKDASYP